MAETTARPIACIDLNGVLDSYTGWQGPAHFDPPPGWNCAEGADPPSSPQATMETEMPRMPTYFISHGGGPWPFMDFPAGPDGKKPWADL